MMSCVDNSLQSPVFSVLVCTYNQEHYIGKALDSILSQECDFSFEILVGDDCSSDNTKKIIKEYVSKYPKIIIPVYHNRNVGASRNLVSLIRTARGCFVSICDGDDYWANNQVLQKQYEAFSSFDDVGMLCAKARCYLQDRGSFEGTLGDERAETLLQMLENNSDVAAPTISFRKSILLDCVNESSWYIGNNYFYDTIIAYWFASKSRIRFINEELAVYRVLPDSSSRSLNPYINMKYDERYFSVKWHFILEYPLEASTMYNLLMSDYREYVGRAAWYASERIRATMSYKLGRIMVSPFKFVFSLIKRRAKSSSKTLSRSIGKTQDLKKA